MDRADAPESARLPSPTGRVPARMITVWNKDGSCAGSMVATPAQEQAVIKAGGKITEGQAAAGSRLNLSTGKPEPAPPAPISIDGNTISGIPANAEVFVGCTQVAPTTRGTITLVPQHGIADRVRLSIIHPLHADTEMDVEIAPVSPDARRKEYVVPQDPDLMRQVAYREEIGDGNQIDTLVKALAEIIAALPQLDGPAVREAKALIARRETIKAQLPKPTKG